MLEVVLVLKELKGARAEASEKVGTVVDEVVRGAKVGGRAGVGA